MTMNFLKALLLTQLLESRNTSHEVVMGDEWINLGEIYSLWAFGVKPFPFFCAWISCSQVGYRDHSQLTKTEVVRCFFSISSLCTKQGYILLFNQTLEYQQIIFPKRRFTWKRARVLQVLIRHRDVHDFSSKYFLDHNFAQVTDRFKMIVSKSLLSYLFVSKQ